jgi:ELMO domain-containing protein
VRAVAWRARAFRWAKAVWHWLTGTTELERVCTWQHADPGRRVQAVEVALWWSVVVGDVHRRLTCRPDGVADAPDRGAESTETHADAAVRAIVARKRLGPAPWVAAALRPAVHRIAAWHAWARHLQALAGTPYDAANADHERLLWRLWDALQPVPVAPSPSRPPRVGAHWQTLGFQGSDPATDFRGMGVLGLHCLVHLAEAHTADARALLAQSQHAVRWYPFALVVISVGNHLRKLLADPWLRHVWYAEPQLDLAIFCDAVSVATVHFGKCWAAAPEDITAFPAVFARHEAAWVQRLASSDRTPRRADV